MVEFTAALETFENDLTDAEEAELIQQQEDEADRYFSDLS